MGFDVLPNGDLEVTIDNETADAMKTTEDYFERLSIFEYMVEEDGWTLLEPADICALTSSLIICDDQWDAPECGYPKLPREGAKVWWFERYQIEDPLDTLMNTGRVVFDRAPERIP